MNFTRLTTAEEVSSLIAWHNEHSQERGVVLDTETTSKDPLKARLVDIQMEGREPDAVAIFGAEFLPLLKSLKVLQIGQNWIRYDWRVAYLHGTDLRTPNVRDTLFMGHLRDENADHDLDSWVSARGDLYKRAFWEKYDAYLDASEAERIEYACKDVIWQRRFYEWLKTELVREEIPESLVDHVHRLACALFDTEIAGVRVDLDYTAQMGGELKKSIVETENELRKLSGYHCDILELRYWAKATSKAWTPKGWKWKTLPKPDFNWNAYQQVQDLLYGQLELPVQRHAKTKKPTADDKALEKLGNAHPVLPELRKLRKYVKMHGTFVEGVLDRVQEGRIYPSFHPCGTVTGRISHSDPNMGQMPSKGEWVKIRGIFIPDQDHVLITCDYSQLEVCIEAHFSLDPSLLRIINEGMSKHDITAEGVGLERGVAKTLNFAMQYRCGVPMVAKIVGCSMPDAQKIFDRYWQVYAGVQAVYDECCAKVARGEPIVNPFGRKRRLPNSFAQEWQQEEANRQAYSSLIQGTGSEFTSYSFYTVSEWLKATGYGRAWFTVHDEVLLQCLPRHVDQVRAKTIEIMTGAAKLVNLRVPLSVECSEPLTRWEK